MKASEVRVLPALDPGESYVDETFMLVETARDERGDPVTTIEHVASRVVGENVRWQIATLGQSVPLSHAAAYRLLISDVPDAAKAGAQQELYVPPRMMQFFERDERPASSESDQIELGYINCFGNTFAWQGKPILVDIYALFADGSEQRVGSTPMRVEPPAPGANAHKK